MTETLPAGREPVGPLERAAEGLERIAPMCGEIARGIREMATWYRAIQSDTQDDDSTSGGG
jgi:hypothetical protein